MHTSKSGGVVWVKLRGDICKICHDKFFGDNKWLISYLIWYIYLFMIMGVHPLYFCGVFPSTKGLGHRSQCPLFTMIPSFFILKKRNTSFLVGIFTHFFRVIMQNAVKWLVSPTKSTIFKDFLLFRSVQDFLILS